MDIFNPLQSLTIVKMPVIYTKRKKCMGYSQKGLVTVSKTVIGGSIPFAPAIKI